MADIIFNSFKEYAGDGTIDLDDHTFKLALLADTYTPAASHVNFGDVSAHQISGTGYTAGGAALGSVTWGQTGGTGTLDAADVSWTSATFTARYAVLYDDTAANDPLVKLFDFSANKSCSNGTFTVQFNASGILTIS